MGRDFGEFSHSGWQLWGRSRVARVTEREDGVRSVDCGESREKAAATVGRDDGKRRQNGVVYSRRVGRGSRALVRTRAQGQLGVRARKIGDGYVGG